MRIAIVGSGISGLSAAHLLAPKHEVVVFEAEQRVGGHVHTWDFEADGKRWAVDSGFIVYNQRNYPRFSRLLAELGVATQPSTMSFSVLSPQEGFEFNPSTLGQLLANPENGLRPSFWRLLADILRFHREAGAGSPHQTLGDFLEQGRFGRRFRDHYLVPMTAAIWSQPTGRVLEMPTGFLFRFFSNHGMLQVDDRPQWRVVSGGSRRYVEALMTPFRDRIRTTCPVRRVERFADRVEVDGASFDQVVLACHSDQALALLADPSAEEREILGALPYQTNQAVVHTDTSWLPRRRRAWAAWNYLVSTHSDQPPTLTYNMNILQGLTATTTFLVTLNPPREIPTERMLGQVQYHHPIFSVAGVAAQARRHEISGVRRTHFCGAYWGFGFHEDGAVSGEAVARELFALEQGP